MKVSTWGLPSCICKDFIEYEATNFHSPIWFSPKSYCWWENRSSEQAHAFSKISAYMSHLQTTQCKPATTPSLHWFQEYYLHILLIVIVCINMSIDDSVYLLMPQREHEFPKKRSSSLSPQTQSPAPGQWQAFGKHLLKEWMNKNHSVRATEVLALHSRTVPDLITLRNWCPVSN